MHTLGRASFVHHHWQHCARCYGVKAHSLMLTALASPTVSLGWSSLSQGNHSRGIKEQVNRALNAAQRQSHTTR